MADLENLTAHIEESCENLREFNFHEFAYLFYKINFGQLAFLAETISITLDSLDDQLTSMNPATAGSSAFVVLALHTFHYIILQILEKTRASKALDKVVLSSQQTKEYSELLDNISFIERVISSMRC
jgi:hypothetical protein